MNINVNIDPSDRYTKRLVAMISAEVSAKIEEIKSALAAEGEQVKAAIDDLKAQVQAGMDQSELLAALDGLKPMVEGIYSPDLVVTPEAPTEVVPPSEPVA